MHDSNMEFWKYCKNKYNKYFVGNNNILELGSYNINGSVKVCFEGYEKYIGVDWRAGPGVDHVSLFHEIKFDYLFDTIISANAFEHDPFWEKSITNAVSLLKEDGIILFGWGSCLQRPHEIHTAPDNKFHSLSASKMINLINSLGIYIHEFRYEGLFTNKKLRARPSYQGLGEALLVAFKGKQYAIGDAHFDPLTKEDQEN